MTDKTRFIDARRRGFLKGGAAVAGAGVTGQSLANGLAEEPAPVRKTLAPKSAGYRETEHVREYYARARY